jgi:hypothetical protein
MLLLGACSGEMATESNTPAPDALLGGLVSGVVRTVGSVVNGLLSCTLERSSGGSAVIGPPGGTIRMGQHTLTVPRGALSADVLITGEVVSGRTNSVRLSPHGLQFSQPGVLVVGYSNCRSVIAPKLVAYVAEDLTILEGLRSRDGPRANQVTAWLDHFSRYAVAW